MSDFMIDSDQTHGGGVLNAVLSSKISSDESTTVRNRFFDNIDNGEFDASAILAVSPLILKLETSLKKHSIGN